MEDKTEQALKLASWKIYPKLHLGEVSLGDKTYQYFAEDLSVKPVELDTLPLEFFNHELQKVDTMYTQSMLNFCEKWGLVFSPLYASKLHAQSARDIVGGPGYASYYPTIYRNGVEAVEQRLAADIQAFKGSYGFNSEEKAIALLLGSELARETIARKESVANKHFGAVVSVDEVAYTIRLLQLATAVQVASSAGFSGKEIIDYTFNARAVQGKHGLELEEKSKNLFFSNTEIAQALLWQQKVTSEEDSAFDETMSEQETRLARMRALESISADQAAENSRTFLNQAQIMMALENSWGREDPGKDFDWMNNLFWGIPDFIEEGSLLESILASFRYVMDAPYDWQMCDYCGRVFKFQKEYDPAKRYRVSRFCKNSCRVTSYQLAEQEAHSEDAALNVDGIDKTGDTHSNN